MRSTSWCRPTAGRCLNSTPSAGATDALPEPREALVADVTGDKKNDLIVLVHDRILVYPQE